MRAALADVSITIPLMVYLVVVRHDEARGLLAGNYIASTFVLLGLWWNERARLLAGFRRAPGAPPIALRRMLDFGLPTVPADASVYALQVADRWYLLRDYSVGAAGLYAVSSPASRSLPAGAAACSDTATTTPIARSPGSLWVGRSTASI